GHAPQALQVALPLIQRGFVWKPHQIVELWDTLLQDMPIGALLVSEMASDAKAIALDADRQLIDISCSGERLALVDGQQRTLAMLSGWPLPPGTAYTHRLWVDFADTPRSGERLRLRITTRNQPFGFQRDDASSKLLQAQRRAAKQAWLQTSAGTGKPPNTLPDFADTTPYHHQTTLALDMRQLVQWWQDSAGDVTAWSRQVLQALQALQMPRQVPPETSSDKPSSPVWELVSNWKQLPQTGEHSHAAVHQRIATLATGLAHLHAADVALLRVAPELFAITTDDTDPPLALLFKRLGSNATKLSDDDYVYAILKHLEPTVHDLVNDLHGQQNAHRTSVASLLSATDLAMSALRLAAAHYNTTPLTQPVLDPENPGKQEFHRLIRHAGFLENSFLPLLQKDGPMRQWFDRVLACLDYRQADAAAALHDAGLPRYALPQLSRALVQVLLRLAQINYLGTATAPLDSERRSDVLRLVLYWWVCVHDQHKASRLAYQAIAQAVAEMQSAESGESTAITSNQLGQRIAQALVAKEAARALPTPEDIQNCPGLCPALLPNQHRQAKVPGWSRFDATQHGDTGTLLRDFWRSWCAPWGHQHPLLLWLQRSYVAQLHGDPVAGRDEDTPYDYDHILPSAHWAGWTGAAQNHLRFIDHCEDAGMVGNSIGNIRVWNSGDNRSDGDTAPAYKLELVAQHGILEDDAAQASRLSKRAQALQDSAIDEDQTPLWQSHLPPCNTRAAHRQWTRERAWQLEEVVSRRALALYQQFYQDAGFTASFTEQKVVETPAVSAL
ncbi:MAG: DUF262 domain-containing protein, partial [Rhodoferax sp.]|nr:DUF262 domain-containing protein [Rhodoferax sp.]